ncbi:MAG: hypothetical protein ACLPHI_08100 [Terriglobales bacterium]
MKLLAVIGTAALSLTLGLTTFAYAQQEQHDQQEEQKAKPAQQDEKKVQSEKPGQQEEKGQPEKNTKTEDKTTQQQKPSQEHEAQQAKSQPQTEKVSNNRIPADRYKASFGRQHTFHVSQSEYSNHRFQYGGYWFGFGQPWPSNWLYTQDVYVIEINGMYYLCNPMYPGVNLTLSFTL